MSAELSLAVAVAFGLLAVLALAYAWRLRRQVVRRVSVVSARLDAAATAQFAGADLESVLSALELAADSTAERDDDATSVVERLAGSLRRVAEGVVVCDEQGDVVFRNKRAEDLLNERHTAAIAADTLDRLLASARSGAPDRQVLDLFGPPRRTLAITAHPLETGSRRVGAVAVIDDVTERRRLDAVRRDFVANISHELKTPVGALGLLAETILAEDDPDTIRRFAGRMQAESFRVAKIIDDLLDLSRIEAEESPSREPVPVHLVLAQACERVRPLAEHRSIAIDMGEPSKSLTIVGDRRQLVSAVHNLLENAVKYSDEGSAVQVRARRAGGWIEISVRDRGIGIPARDLERIFERFYRVDRARARETGGTGLGLAIVRHVASNHGGEVRVSSQEGRGSTFTLLFPATPGEASLTVVEAG